MWWQFRAKAAILFIHNHKYIFKEKETFYRENEFIPSCRWQGSVEISCANESCETKLQVNYPFVAATNCPLLFRREIKKREKQCHMNLANEGENKEKIHSYELPVVQAPCRVVAVTWRTADGKRTALRARSRASPWSIVEARTCLTKHKNNIRMLWSFLTGNKFGRHLSSITQSPRVRFQWGKRYIVYAYTVLQPWPDEINLSSRSYVRSALLNTGLLVRSAFAMSLRHEYQQIARPPRKTLSALIIVVLLQAPQRL